MQNKKSDPLTQSVIHTSTQKTHVCEHPVLHETQLTPGHTDVQRKSEITTNTGS